MLTPKQSPEVDKFLEKLTKADRRVAERIAEKIIQICRDPEAPGTKKMYPSEYRSARVGNYRIVYLFSSEVLYVELIEHRKDIYKKFQRLTRH